MERFAVRVVMASIEAVDAQCAPAVHAFALWLRLPLERGGASMTCTEALARLEPLAGDRVVEAFGGKWYRTSNKNGEL